MSVYKIVNDIDDKVYVGSTFDKLSRRMVQHRQNAKTKETTIHNHMRNIGIEHFKIILLQRVETEDRDVLRATEHKWISELDTVNNGLNRRYGIQKCEHNKKRSTCKDCKGGSICEHDREKYHCKECKGGGICEHDREKYHCKECKGGGICEHNKQKRICKTCNSDKYKCEKCNKIFGSKKGLIGHINNKNIHPDPLPEIEEQNKE
jgi:hypothetical protein